MNQHTTETGTPPPQRVNKRNSRNRLKLVPTSLTVAADTAEATAARIASNGHIRQEQPPATFEMIPAELRSRNQWVCFKLAPKSGQPDKLDKIPYNARTGRKASSKDADTWVSFDEAVTAYEFVANGYQGVGYMFSADDPFVGVDLDRCYSPETRTFTPWGQEFINLFATYAEFSPSITGVHLIGRGVCGSGNKKPYQGGVVEKYDKGRFFTVTGNHVQGTPQTINDVSHALPTLQEKVWGSRGDNDDDGSDNTQGTGYEQGYVPWPTEAELTLFGKMAASQQHKKFLTLWLNARKGSGDPSADDAALVTILAWWLKKDARQIDRWFRASNRMRRKWDTPHYGDGRTYGQYLIHLAITEWVDDTYHGDGADAKTDAGRDAIPDYELLTDEEAENLPPVRGVVGDVLFEDSVGIFYGPSGLLKTYTGLDMGLSVATGTPWMGHPVKQGLVVYIISEGTRDVGKRIRAWKRYHGITGKTNLRILREPVHFLNPNHITGLIQSIRTKLQGENPVLIFVDTLSRAIVGGNENITPDASALITAGNLVRMAFGCCVCFIHHTGWGEQNRLRGNSTLYNDSDTVFKVEVDGNGPKRKLVPGDVVHIISDKARNTANFQELTITTTLEMWTETDTETGEVLPVSSLVVIPCDASGPRPIQRPTRPPKGKYPPSAIRIWDVLVKLCVDLPDGVRYAPLYKATIMGKENTMAESTFAIQLKRLQEGGWIVKNDEFYRPEEGDRAGSGTADFS